MSYEDGEQYNFGVPEGTGTPFYLSRLRKIIKPQPE
jgi:hypothetical protein